MSKILVDRELLEYLADLGDEAIERMGSYLAEKHGAQKYVDAARAILAQPAEAEGVEVIAYATPNEDGDWQMLFFDEKEAIQYVDDEPPAPLVLQSAHIAALSAVTAERDRLLVDLERAHRATNSECMDWAREYERRKEVQAERDQLRAEVEALRAENERLSQQLAQSDAALRESRANDMENVRTLENMWERHDALRQELEALRKDAERYRWASSGVHEAETLVSIVNCHGGYAEKVAERVDVYREAAMAAKEA